MGASRRRLAQHISDFPYIPAAMMKGRIAIPSPTSLKRSRPKRKRELPADIPTILENVRLPQEIERAKRRAKLPWGVGR